MDLIGEIVEHDVEAPVAPTKIEVSGFPQRSMFKDRKKKGSRFMQKRNQPQPVKPEEEELTEAEKIHRENMEKISQLTEAEIDQERQELLNGLDPKLIQSLLKRTEDRVKKEACCDGDVHDHAEGYHGWIGGTKDEDISRLDAEDVDRALGIQKMSIDDKPPAKPILTNNNSRESLPRSLKSVRFSDVATVKYEEPAEEQANDEGWEDVEDIKDDEDEELDEEKAEIEYNEEDEIAHEDYQIVKDDEDDVKVHFPKPKSKSNDDLDLNDPDFFDKLHEKYYPDLPKENQKLSWMTDPMPQQVSTTYDCISDMRFDFQGNLVELNESGSQEKEIPTYKGLHHHSENPHLAGYTLAELGRLSRSVVAPQRCFSIQMLGRILHKLGLHKYNILPMSEKGGEEDEGFYELSQELIDNFENMMWDLIEELRIIESIEEAADEQKTRNLSVRNYALEALWLWKQGGGRKSMDTDEEYITKAVQN